jgi:hypothetical protein
MKNFRAIDNKHVWTQFRFIFVYQEKDLKDKKKI